MNHHAWLCKKLSFAVAVALAFVPLCAAAEPQEAGSQTSQLNPITATQPTGRPPQVHYEEGQLTIIAENSSLTDVMKALSAVLAADIDLPAGVVNQRIWVHLGPGPARRVLRDLLDGTEFNYVIQASESDADGIRSVLLTQRGKSTGAEAAGPAERVTERVAEKGAIRKIPRSGSDVAGAPDSPNPSSEPVASNDPPPTAPPPSASPANESAAAAGLQETPTNSDNSTSTAGSRTDQMIQQMQSMFQQRRQIQLQQNQKASQQAPNQ